MNYKNQTKVERLLDKLCSELGFCISSSAHTQLQSNLPLSIDAFTDALFKLEELNPQLEKQLREKVKSRITDWFQVEVTNEVT